MSQLPTQEPPTGPDFQPGDIEFALDQLCAPPSPAPGDVAPPVTPTLVRWSELLGAIPTQQRLKPITEFSRAIHEGVVQAATITEEFSLTYLNANGKEVEFKGHEELIFDTPQVHAWLAQQTTESTYALIRGGGPVEVTEEQIVKGELDFARLAEIRRMAATQNLPERTVTAAASARKPKPKTKRKSMPNTSSKAGQKSGSAKPEKASKDTPTTNE
ncbi:hypothetical protein GCM10008959_40820 [Deinococcus seoulensis]|uniref:Uncharacterized protein n=1 Tax=Deinococcus seoulensis TaxID=1837379 RepID=A0ABQ2RZN7_9DEIO|nr:hypothetical protein [Deinococcus seoulensis]GGR75610.1 hypothetical protein GCM10008959_40820 [Deinococcus seoulensis]